MSPDEVEAMITHLRATGVTGRELARQMQAASGRPFERKGVVDLPAPMLPPVPADNGLALLRAAAEAWGGVEVALDEDAEDAPCEACGDPWRSKGHACSPWPEPTCQDG